MSSIVTLRKAERKTLESKHDKIIMDTHQSLRLFHRYY